MRRPFIISVAASVALLAACPPAPDPATEEATEDAGRSLDSGFEAAPSADAGAPRDGGEAPDDGGAALDAGLQVLDERVGSAALSYMNPEFTPDGRYMVWFEPTSAPRADGRLFGTMWHCAVDLETGELVPPDGRGFAAFTTTIWGRANTGEDRDGPYYVGQRSEPETDAGVDQLVHVRPTGPASAVVTVLTESAPQPRRRSIFPSALADRDASGQFVWWFENDVGFTPSAAEQVTLKYIALSAPSTEYVVTTQGAPGPRWSAMDTTYARFVGGTSFLTLGVPVGPDVEVATFDLASPEEGLTVVTADGRFKLDPYSFVHDGRWYFAAGINQTADSVLYAADGPRGPFVEQETIRPGPGSEIPAEARCQPQSHQTFTFRGQLYSAFQVADCGSGTSFLTRRGEIWLTTLGTHPAQTRRLSRDGAEAKNEPEPVVGRDRAWVFYSAYPAGASPLTAQYELRRVTLR